MVNITKMIMDLVQVRGGSNQYCVHQWRMHSSVSRRRCWTRAFPYSAIFAPQNLMRHGRESSATHRLTFPLLAQRMKQYFWLAIEAKFDFHIHIQDLNTIHNLALNLR